MKMYQHFLHLMEGHTWIVTAPGGMFYDDSETGDGTSKKLLKDDTFTFSLTKLPKLLRGGAEVNHGGAITEGIGWVSYLLIKAKPVLRELHQISNEQKQEFFGEILGLTKEYGDFSIECTERNIMLRAGHEQKNIITFDENKKAIILIPSSGDPWLWMIKNEIDCFGRISEGTAVKYGSFERKLIEESKQKDPA